MISLEVIGDLCSFNLLTHCSHEPGCSHMETSEKTTINEKIVAALPIPEKGNKVHFFSGATLQGKKAPAGFGVRVTAAEARSFVWLHRVDGRQYLETIGPWRGNPGGGKLAVLDAIEKCFERSKAVATGVQRDKGGKIVKDEQGKPVAVDVRPSRTRTMLDGDKPAGLTVADMLDQFVKRHVDNVASPLRSAGQIKDVFERLVKPRIGKLDIQALDIDPITKMLDQIEDDSGPVMATRTLAYFRKACNWQAARGGKFKSPIVIGMARGQTSMRQRVLVKTTEEKFDPQELVDVLTALEIADVPDCYRRYIKLLLLCVSRRNEVAGMHSSEITGNTWTVPAARYKRLPKNAHLDHIVPLSAAARELIGPLPDKPGFMISTTGGKLAFSGFSKCKVALDKAIAEIREKSGRPPIENWTLHDIRRTGRTLMAHAGVMSEIAERCMGHLPPKLERNYNTAEYTKERRDAFEKLASLVSTILNPPQGNVVPMRA